ncbi:Hypothetical protein R9X50_00710800 [Acrodontium crateriforme]|uniref:DUF2241 domain-containing protein n=1 Tax=Acrodontium crateriforme TaxID=150365 RepID=A0AAQ3M9M7_9PEZI|nr:Hypothetical protein R9X50_00710800 [Acrodontium crateriforme]
MVFAHIPKGQAPAPELISASDMIFNETEGMSLIIPQTVAQKTGIRHEFPCKKITLNVHSSLDAVGFLAAITTRLVASLNVGVNRVSGFFHDHLFVPLGKENAVMEELKAMAAEEK